MTSKSRNKTGAARIAIIIAFVACVATGGIVVGLHLKNESDRRAADPNRPLTLEEAVKAEVEGRLKAPATAVFQDRSKWKVEKRLEDDYNGGKREHTYVILEVDAQNGFGAMLRSKYEVEVWGSDISGWRASSFKELPR